MTIKAEVMAFSDSPKANGKHSGQTPTEPQSPKSDLDVLKKRMSAWQLGIEDVEEEEETPAATKPRNPRHWDII